jgi:hypothetical protein
MKSFIRISLIAASLLAVTFAHAAPEEQASAKPASQPAQAARSSRVLPLDHGPRAQSTPWVNAQIRQREAREAEQARLATGRVAAETPVSAN